MKKWIKILIIIISTPIVLFGIFVLSYVIINQQGVIEPFNKGNPNSVNKILIASQGSEFKNNLVKNILSQLKSDKNYFSVIDCTTLGNENEEDWDAIIIIHTLQVHEMPEEARVFLSEANDPTKIMLVSTSGAGDDVAEGFDVDAISSASRNTAIPVIMKWISKNLNEIIRIEITSAGNRK